VTLGDPAPRAAWTDRAAADDIHRRLLEGDPVAASELAAACLDPLADWLRGRNPRIAPDVCDTAAEDALLALIKAPSSYKPDRLPLDAYLRMSASGDLKNALAKDRRRSSREAVVELSSLGGNLLRDDDGDPAKIVELRDAVARAARDRERAAPTSFRDALTPEERAVYDLMRMNERRTATYARALHIAHLAPDEQRRLVKRAKDRLKKRLERMGGLRE
jgi:RNA polymerase sigma-70 factor, ECF subfamily